MQVLSIGEVLWDIFPDGERLGGAPLNFAAHLKRFGDEAILVSAIGDDPRGRLALDRMRQFGLSSLGITVSPRLPTGIAVITMEPDGGHSFEIPRPAAFDDAVVGPEILEGTKLGAFDWLYFGTLLQMTSSGGQIIKELLEASTNIRCFYDMNLREGHWTLDLVQRLADSSTILKTNEAEAKLLHDLIHGGNRKFSLKAFCMEWSEKHKIAVICITRGADGCFVYERGAASAVPGCHIEVCDTVGAGDAFSAAFLHAYAHDWSLNKAALYANALGAIVASRAGATPDWSVEELERMLGEQPE